MLITDSLSNIFTKLLFCTLFVFIVFVQSTIAQLNVYETLPLVKCSEYKPEFSDVRSFVYGNGVFYIAGLSGYLSAIDANDGKQNWSVELGGKTISDPIIWQENVYIITSTINDEDSVSPGDAFLRSLSKHTGLTNTIIRLPAADKYYLDQRPDGHLILVSSAGTIAAISESSGELLWQKNDLGTIDQAPAFSNRAIAISDQIGNITTLSRSDGRIIDQYKTNKRITALSIFENNDLIYGDEAGNITLSDNSGRNIKWNFKSGGRISNITQTENGLLVSSYDNFLYLIQIYNGKVSWRRRMPSRLIYPPVTQDKAIILPIYGEEYILTLNLKDGKLVNRIEMGQDIYSDSSPQIISDNSFSILADGKVVIFKPFGCN